MTEASGLQAVFDRFLDDFKHPPLSPDQERACRPIEQCRYPCLGRAAAAMRTLRL